MECISDNSAARVRSDACSLLMDDDGGGCCVLHDDYFLRTLVQLASGGDLNQLYPNMRTEVLALEHWDFRFNNSSYADMDQNVRLHATAKDTPLLARFASVVKTRKNITLQVHSNDFDVSSLHIEAVRGEVTIESLMSDENASVTARSVRTLLMGDGTTFGSGDAARPLTTSMKLSVGCRITRTLGEMARIFMGPVVIRADIRIAPPHTARDVMTMLTNRFNWKQSGLGRDVISDADENNFVSLYPENKSCFFSLLPTLLRLSYLSTYLFFIHDASSLVRRADIEVTSVFLLMGLVMTALPPASMHKS